MSRLRPRPGLPGRQCKARARVLGSRFEAAREQTASSRICRLHNRHTCPPSLACPVYPSHLQVDATPPRAGAIFDARAPEPCASEKVSLSERAGCDATDGAEGGDVEFLAPTKRLKGWWRGFTDYQSGISHYRVCAGSGMGACDLAPWTKVHGNKIKHVISLQNELQHNESGCISVEAFNGVGVGSGVVSSDCAIVDATPPLSLSIGVGFKPGQHADGVINEETVFGWFVGADDLSQLDSVQWCVATGPGALRPVSNPLLRHPQACP